MPYTPSVVSHTDKPAASGHCSQALNQKGELLGLLLNSTRNLILLSHTWIDSFTFSSTPVDTENYTFFYIKKDFCCPSRLTFSVLSLGNSPFL